MKLPHKISYTMAVKGGSAKMFFIKINPKYKDDKGLLAHEYEHVKQWYIVTFTSLLLLASVALFWKDAIYFAPVCVSVFPMCYTYITAFRKGSEVKAFREQLKHYPQSFDYLSRMLASNYNLGITIAQAKRLLRV